MPQFEKFPVLKTRQLKKPWIPNGILTSIKKTTYDAFPPYGIKKNQTLNIITINLTRSKNYTRKNTYQLSFI